MCSAPSSLLNQICLHSLTFSSSVETGFCATKERQMNDSCLWFLFVRLNCMKQPFKSRHFNSSFCYTTSYLTHASKSNLQLAPGSRCECDRICLYAKEVKMSDVSYTDNSLLRFFTWKIADIQYVGIFANRI